MMHFERRNAIVIPILQKGDRQKRPKKLEELVFFNTCYEIYSKILNIKLHRYSAQFMTETQYGFRKGRSCTYSTFCLKLLTEK